MVKRIAGPDPPGGHPKPVWTRKRVILSMVGAWREGRRPSFQGRLSTMRTALDWAALYIPMSHPLGGEAHNLLILFLWSQAEGTSFRDLCRSRGGLRSRSTAMRRVNWALDQIVDGLNLDAGSVAA